MAQEFWDENKQQEMLELRKQIYLDWAKQVADRFTELDLPERRQLINEISDLLRKNNVDFEVDNYLIKIKGNLTDVRLAGFRGGPERIGIVQGDKMIIWETHMDYSILYIKSLTTSDILGEIKLPRDLPGVFYSYPYLYLKF